MPLLLNPEQLWEKVKESEGTKFCSIERKLEYKIVEVADRVLNLKSLDDDTIKPLRREDIIKMYRFVDENTKYTSSDFRDIRIKGVNEIPRIIALLPHVVPEEIEAFSQDQGEIDYGERRRGIRKKDC